MQYREEKNDSKIYKEAYVGGFSRVLEERRKCAEIKRKAYAEGIFEHQAQYREAFKKMLGWPLVDYQKSGLPGVSMTKLSEEEGYSIYRAQFEILDGLTMTGLFFRADGDAKKPLVILQHGGQGTPELIADVYGDTANYNDMLHRVRKHGVHVFALQLLLWSDEYKVKYDRIRLDAQLKRVGSSITAVEVFGIMRILDYFEAQNFVSKFGMVGLSYGGFYTLFTAAADERIQSAISCSFFNTRDAEDWCDWVWFRSAEYFDDAEIACLVYPRKLCVEIGTKDELFDVQKGIESFERVKELCEKVGTDWVSLEVFEGVHEFSKNDEPIENLIRDLT